jgi:hypothetical protein
MEQSAVFGNRRRERIPVFIDEIPRPALKGNANHADEAFIASFLRLPRVSH